MGSRGSSKIWSKDIKLEVGDEAVTVWSQRNHKRLEQSEYESRGLGVRKVSVWYILTKIEEYKKVEGTSKKKIALRNRGFILRFE